MAQSRGKTASTGMVPHLINFRPTLWEEAREIALLADFDDVSSFVREAVREKIDREKKKRVR